MSTTSLSTTPATTKVFALNVTLNVKPERRNDFLAVIIHDKKQTLATEPGAIQFVVGEDVASPNTFYLHEQYQTKDDFDHHTKTEHYATWKKFCNEDPFTSAPVVNLYNPL
jgi:quinol monooxygenase YgiN